MTILPLLATFLDYPPFAPQLSRVISQSVTHNMSNPADWCMTIFLDELSTCTASININTMVVNMIMATQKSRLFFQEQKITDEQQYAVDLAKAGHSFKIAAFAGTGKTTTLRAIANAMQGKRGLYLSFNKATADEAAQSFPRHVECKTAHSLAYAGAGYVFKNRLNQRLTVTQTADVLDIKDVGADSPSEISPLRFLCIGFRHHKNVADCINKLTMLTASGICVSPVAYMVLCVRFVSFVHICRSRNRKQRSARNATLDTGGWLDLTKSILRLLPSGTFTLKETTSFACRTVIIFSCQPLVCLSNAIGAWT